jgi:hypothetical protein
MKISGCDIQSSLNDNQLTLGDGGKIPVDMIEYGEKKILVQTDQARTTEGKNMIVLNELRNKMIKP